MHRWGTFHTPDTSRSSSAFRTRAETIADPPVLTGGGGGV